MKRDTSLKFRNFMKYGNIELVKWEDLILIVFLFCNFVNFVFAQETGEQVYVCPLARKMEEINPRCECRIDLVLGETVSGSCQGATFEMTLGITEYEGHQYYLIYGFENGGAGVNSPPQARISGEFDGREGENLNFSASNSSDPNGDLLDFYWDFGDGNSAFGENVSHQYEREGNFLLSLTVFDGMASSTATATIKISSPQTLGGQVKSIVKKETNETHQPTSSQPITPFQMNQRKQQEKLSSLEMVEVSPQPQSGVEKQKEEEKIAESQKIGPGEKMLLASLIGLFKENPLLSFLEIILFLFVLTFFLWKIKNSTFKKTI